MAYIDKIQVGGTEYDIQDSALKSALNDVEQCFDMHESKNLLNLDTLEIGKLLNTSTGEISDSANFGTTDFIEISSSAVFSTSYNIGTSTTPRYVLYSASKQWLDGNTFELTDLGLSQNNRWYYILQTNGNAKYVKICFSKSVWQNEALKAQVENGTLPTSYELHTMPEIANIKDSKLPGTIFDNNSNPPKLLESALPDSVPVDFENILELINDSALYNDHAMDYVLQLNAIAGTDIVVTPPETAGKLVHCKNNLFDQSQFLKNTNISFDNGYYHGMGSYFTAVIPSLVLPKFKPYKTYIVSFTAYASTAMNFKIGWKYDDNSTRWSSGVGTTETTITWSSMPSAYKQTGDGKTVTGIDFTWSTSGQIYIKNFQITESRDALDYEPFDGNITEFDAESDNITLTAFDGINNIYCTNGKCSVSYYRKRIGAGDGFTAVCMGDSITGNYTAPTDYPSFAHAKTGINAINCGFGGTRMSLHTETAKQPFSFCSLIDAIISGDFSAQYIAAENSGIYNVYDHLYNLENVDWSKVNYLVVFYGTNDFTAQVPIDNENDLDDTSTYIGAFRYGVAKFLAEHPNVRILGVTPMYRYFNDASKDSDEQQYGGKYLYEFGNALIDVCKEYKTPSLDMYYVSGVNAITREYFIDDGTHPSEAGRKNIGSIIADSILSVF